MARKISEIYPCNLLELRKKLDLTQKKLGEILGVSERMISYYETGEKTLPIDRAIFLCKEYNCTLDWMYCNPTNAKSTVALSDKIEEYPKFIVDIRDFLSCCKDSVYFTIPNYYWEYMKRRNAITASKSPNGEKKRKIAELNGSYEIRESEQKYWRVSIKAKEFLSYLRFDSEFVPFADASDSSAKDPTKEQLEEATAFIKYLTEMNDDM